MRHNTHDGEPPRFDVWQDCAEFVLHPRRVVPGQYRIDTERAKDEPLYEVGDDGRCRIVRRLTQFETATLLGVSHQACQQVEKRALRKLRERLGVVS